MRTVAYADVFDFPLDRCEIYRYCLAPAGSRETIDETIRALVARGSLCTGGSWVFLPGRHHIVFSRRRLRLMSQPAWKSARRWAHVMWMLPWVRMVAVTGSLAVDSKREDQDIDYMIVAEPGRLWLTRVLCLLVWRLAKLRGIRLCPNYLITTNALELRRRDLYTARELVQMVPLHGRAVAEPLWACNRWTLDLLPNASLDPALASDAQSGPARHVKRTIERLLSGRLVDRIEAWERQRKIAKLSAEVAGTHESSFSADECKHHANAHGTRVLDLYALRLTALDEHDEPLLPRRGVPERSDLPASYSGWQEARG